MRCACVDSCKFHFRLHTHDRLRWFLRVQAHTTAPALSSDYCFRLKYVVYRTSPTRMIGPMRHRVRCTAFVIRSHITHNICVSAHEMQSSVVSTLDTDMDGWLSAKMCGRCVRVHGSDESRRSRSIAMVLCRAVTVTRESGGSTSGASIGYVCYLTRGTRCQRTE